MNIKKTGYMILGFIGLGLGAVGAMLPLIPCFPFLLLAAYGFAKSSECLHTWFIGTKMYKENLETYVEKKGMTKKAKLRIITFVSITMAIGFVMMANVPVGRVCLGLVWMVHVIYLGMIVKTVVDE